MNNDLIIGFNAGVASVSESKDIAVAEVNVKLEQKVLEMDVVVDALLESETTINEMAITIATQKESFEVLAESVVSEVARQVAKTGRTMKAKSKKDNATIKSQGVKIETLESDASATSLRNHTRDGYNAKAIRSANLLNLAQSKSIDYQQEVINKLLFIVGENAIMSSDMGTLTKLVNKLGI